MSLIIWVYFELNVSFSAKPLRTLGCELKFFNETQNCLDYIKNNFHENIF